jgi:hypothetical protein
MAGAPLLEQAVHRARADPDRAAALLADCLPLQAALVDLLPRRQVVAMKCNLKGGFKQVFFQPGFRGFFRFSYRLPLCSQTA